MKKKIKAAIFHNDVTWIPGGKVFDKVFSQGRLAKLAELTALYPERISSSNLDEHLDRLKEIEVIFSTWSMPLLLPEQIRKMPRLKTVFYAAGATSSFRKPLEECGVTVCSAAPANAIPVAEFALSQILLAGAGYFRSIRESTCKEAMRQENSYRGHGNYGGRVAIMGNGAISTRLQELLAVHDLDIVVVPSRKEARTISMEEAFATSFAVVNLFPDRDDNAGIFHADIFRQMINSAVFINVGRGRQVNENDLITVMKERPDLTALLDVQHPEPPEDDSGMYTQQNILLSAHIAGSKSSELVRMADYMIEDFIRYANDESFLYQVQPDQL